jgi:hypothetical protein
MLGYGPDRAGSRKAEVTGTCECGNEPSGSVKCGELVKWNTNLMQHCAGFISAESLYMFRAQSPIISLDDGRLRPKYVE